MYIEFNKDIKLMNKTEYLCVAKGYDDTVYYTILTWYDDSNVIGDYDFDGAGFYNYDSEYGYSIFNEYILAYQEIEKYIRVKQDDKL